MIVELTEEQKAAVLKLWNESPPNKPPTLLQLIDIAFPGQGYDGRSIQGRAVKAFLASRELKSSHAAKFQSQTEFVLTEEHKELIVNNLQMTPLQIARLIASNPNLSPGSKEFRAVYEFYNSLPGKVKIPLNEQIIEDEYKPPKTINQVVARVNLYVQNANLNIDKLSTRHKKDLNSLIGYLHTYRFVHQMNTYDKKVDRELFESTFVRYTWDKNDLTEEEIDQNIILSTEVVIANSILRHINDLQQLLDEIAQGDGEEKKKFSMGLVEAMGQARKEYNECVARTDKMIKNLVGTRSKKLENKIQENASILNLVSLWKEEESRLKLIKIAEMEQKLVNDEIDRLSSLEDVKIRCLGLDPEEILHG